MARDKEAREGLLSGPSGSAYGGESGGYGAPADTSINVDDMGGASRPITYEGDGLERGRMASWTSGGSVGEFKTLTAASVVTGGSRLGTFFGAFLPVTLSIFGYVIYIRLGWIIAQCGVSGLLIMLLLGYICALFTYLSISAVSTNGIIKGGGAYYMISRSLGAEFGGSIGVIFYVANVTAAAMYILSGVEAMNDAIPATKFISDTYWNNVVASFAVLTFLTAIALVGAGLFSRSALIFFTLLMISLIMAAISMLVRPSGELDGNFHRFSFSQLSDNMGSDYKPDKVSGGKTLGFHEIFAIFFPAITGFMAGANMSGDLRKPSKSIPKGTGWALIASGLVYLLITFLMGGCLSRSVMNTDMQVLQKVTYGSWYTFIPGEMCSLFASALSSIVGSARVLQAVGKDELLPVIGIFAHGSGKTLEPRRAIIFSYVLIGACIFMGSLDAIAPFNTLSFLLSYAVTNFACFVASLTGVPNFRPRFPYYTWWTALAGTLVNVGYMIFISPMWSGIMTAVFLVVCVTIHYKAPPNEWGDISQALIFHQVRKFLLRLDERKVHIKFWRPSILHLVSSPAQCSNLIQFTNNLKKGGLYILGTVQTGDFQDNMERVRITRIRYLDYIRASNIKAFPEIITAPSLRLGVQSMLSISGLGGMRPNTVMLGLPEEETSVASPLPGAFGGSTYLSSPKKHGIVMASLRSFDDPQHTGTGACTPKLWCDILRDVMSSGRNIIIARNFSRLATDRLVHGHCTDVDPTIYTRESLFIHSSFNRKWWPKGPRPTVDVWVKDLSTKQLPLLLGHVLHITKQWHHKTHLRVVSVVETTSLTQQRRDQIRAMLIDARIEGFIKIVSLEEERLPAYARLCSSKQNAQHGQVYALASEMQKCEIRNEVMKAQSTDTLVCVFSINAPPIAGTEAADEGYTKQLRTLSDGLPPSLMMHSMQEVITSDM